MATTGPFEDPTWLQGLPSPFFKDTHRRFQKACREFIDENLNTNAREWETNGKVPGDVWRKFADANMLVPCLAAPLPVQWLNRLGLSTLPGGVRVAEFDDMHSYIYFDEVRSPFVEYC